MASSSLLLQLPFPEASVSSSSSLSLSNSSSIHVLRFSSFTHEQRISCSSIEHSRFTRNRIRSRGVRPLFANKDTSDASTITVEDDDEDSDPEALEYVSQVKRVLELLRKNRDMLFGEVKLTIMIEDPREVERRQLLGIDDENAPTRDDLAAALEEIKEGKVPKDRSALQMLADEMISWPNLEVEATKEHKNKSLYAKATDTGFDPKEAAKRLNID